WNATAFPVPDIPVHQLFEEQVKRTPQAQAVVFAGHSLSYGELNRRANRLAHRLIAQGIGPESRVGVCLERSLEMIVAVVAVLKAGAAYVPLAADLPAARKQYILEDSGAAALLTHSSLEAPEFNSPCPAYQLDRDPGHGYPESDPPARSSGGNLAYIIYTSGSTGAPKGVMIEQSALVNTITAFNRVYSVSPSDRVLQVAALAFDVSVGEIWPILSGGGTLVIANREDLLDPARFQALLKEERISIFGATPLLLSQLHLQRSELPALRLIFSGGDALAQANLSGIAEDLPLINGYGPTEATIGATAYRLKRNAAENQRIPIGKPLTNYRIHILDERQRPQPIGVPGELHIGGLALARGYLNRPELTAEKFIEVELAQMFQSPVGADSCAQADRLSGMAASSSVQPQESQNLAAKAAPAVFCERLYKSGDRARWLADGNIEFLGRLDHQVKIRGYRIELGEIEAALSAQEGVREAVVIARGAGAERQLAAYVAGERLEASTLRAALKARLPGYMVP
ncbi:MAG: nonribosomal protein synthetase, partial [bacterium]